MTKHKRYRRTKAEMILERYKGLCLTKQEEREGYILSLKDAHKRACKFHQIGVAKKFIKDLDHVIIRDRLNENFPYGQAYFHLKDMVLTRIEELEKEKV